MQSQSVLVYHQCSKKIKNVLWNPNIYLFYKKLRISHYVKKHPLSLAMVMTLSFFVHGLHELVGFGPGRFCWYWHLGACSCMYGKIRWQDQTKYWKTNWAYWKMNQSPTLYWEISLKLRGLPNLQLISTTATGLFTSCLSQQSCPVLVHKLRSITLCWLTSFSLLGSFEDKLPRWIGLLDLWIFKELLHFENGIIFQ